MRSARFFFAAALILLAPIARGASADRLQQQLDSLTRLTDGIAGLSAMHIESHRSVSVRGLEGFPMASAFKVPIAIQIMKMVDEGKLRLDKTVVVRPSDLHPGSGEMTELLYHPGLSLSISNLLELALVISDNSAADLLLREAGGPEAVTARMKALDLNGIRVDRSAALLVSAWSGAKDLPPEEQWTRSLWPKLYNAVPEREHMAARRAQTADPRDTAIPDDMTRLLSRLWSRELLSRQSSETLLDIMARCQTGKARLKGLLPQGTPVAHKTGSLGGIYNDVGIITLPGGAGHVAISVFVKGHAGSDDSADREIAEIARTVYDYFLLVPQAGAPLSIIVPTPADVLPDPEQEAVPAH